MDATEANLALATDKIIPMGDPDTGQPAFLYFADDGVESSANLRVHLLSTLACLTAAWLTKATHSKWFFPMNVSRRKRQ